MNIPSLLLLSLLFLPLAGYAQLDKDLQPTENYSQNKVLSRELSYANTSTDIILVFDESGRLKIEQQKEPKKRNAYHFKMVYQYNDDGKLSSRVDSIYLSTGLDIQICTYAYEKDLMIQCECLGANKSVRSRISYNYFPTRHTETLYRGDSIYRTQTTEYDSIGYRVRFYGNKAGSKKVQTFEADGKIFELKDDPKTWDYHFINEYENGRLVRQTRYKGNQKQEYEEFQYNKKGLLISKFNSKLGINGSQEFFRYKFRK